MRGRIDREWWSKGAVVYWSNAAEAFRNRDARMDEVAISLPRGGNRTQPRVLTPGLAVLLRHAL
jgi:hypothetical protein